MQVAGEWFGGRAVQASMSLTGQLASGKFLGSLDVSQFPVLIPPNITVQSAWAPDNILWMMLGVIAAGTVIMLPALGYLFWLFKSRPAIDKPEPQKPL